MPGRGGIAEREVLRWVEKAVGVVVRVDPLRGTMFPAQPFEFMNARFTAPG